LSRSDVACCAAPRSSRALYTVDARALARHLLTDVDGLRSAAHRAVATGGGHVRSEATVVFPNRAVTLVLVLAESHLSIHTWPEEDLVAIDLFSCGSIDGAGVVEALRHSLGLGPAAVRRVERGLAGCGD
jgi:S-adenosylmethionine decarboxylase